MMGTSRQHYFDFESKSVFFILLSQVNFLIFRSLVFLFLIPHRLYGENSIVVGLLKDFIVLAGCETLNVKSSVHREVKIDEYTT